MKILTPEQVSAWLEAVKRMEIWPHQAQEIAESHETLREELAAAKAQLEHFRYLFECAIMEWNGGPDTMKKTADWANKWVPELAAAINSENRDE